MSLRTAAVSEDREMPEIDAAVQPSAPVDPPEDDTVWVHPHLRWLTGLRAPAFILMMAVYAFIGKMLAFTLISPFIRLSGPGSPATRDPLNMIHLIQSHGMASAFIAAILGAPLVETVLGQWLPVRIGRIFTQRRALLICLSTAAFTAMHLHAGVKGVAVGVSVGVLLAFSFVHWQRVSTARAYWITTAVHALHNGVALGIALLVMA